MRVTVIDRCANIDCTNRNPDGTFTVVSLGPRIFLLLCKYCQESLADYLAQEYITDKRKEDPK